MELVITKQKSAFDYFTWSFLSFFGALFLAYLIEGSKGVVTVGVLAILEIALSFDNAIVNAKILRGWDLVWRRRFLTWGIIVAVFGMRLVCPIVIVAMATGDVWLINTVYLAVYAPQEYHIALMSVHHLVLGFGGTFLYMVGFEYFLGQNKKLHWIPYIEKSLRRSGKYGYILVLIAVGFAAVFLAPHGEEFRFLLSCVFGATAHSGSRWLSDRLKKGSKELQGSIGGFIYIELLDASFSLDGVFGAFAVSMVLVLIMLGLGVGSMFIRSFTVYMVDTKQDRKYIFLPHGAFWSILSLATTMFLKVRFDLDEVVAGTNGSAIILISFSHSLYLKRIRMRKKENRKTASS